MFDWLGRVSSALIYGLIWLGVILLLWAMSLRNPGWLQSLLQHRPRLATQDALTIAGASFLVTAFAIWMSKSRHPGKRALRTIRPWIVVLGVLFVIACIVGATTWLLHEADAAAPADRVGSRIEAIKIGLTVGAGAGGGVALLLAARKQWLSERSQVHDETVSEDQTHDAQERRVAEFFTKAVEQIGSDKAAVRLGGLYSLERLAVEHVTYRQMIVNVICAYLRMPAEDADAAEPQVPETAQRIISRNLVGTRGTAWRDIDIDLSGATLHNFVLQGWQVKTLDLSGAHFTGSVQLGPIPKPGTITLQGAYFDSATDLSRLEHANLSNVHILADSVARTALPPGWLATVADSDGYLRVYRHGAHWSSSR